ncbi:MAG: alpha-glucosidase/alpha-galactosidase [Myxococcota bacterium]|nr:alpha-glucosidase/alpha-galactosidase [Myxococcota bacterium]
MPKITFVGAGSTVFAKNVLGDAMLQPSLHDAEIALYDIDAQRLDDSMRLMDAINRNCNQDRARIRGHLGVERRADALRGADYVVNAIQVGGYDPCTVTDFEIPKNYGLEQTIGDTLGIGGIFRGLRTVPVLLDIARDIERVCPDAWLLNYTNPMAIVTAATLQASEVRTVGLCHSVQECVPGLLRTLGLDDAHPANETRQEIAGINHQSWLLRIDRDGQDLYPLVKERAAAALERIRSRGGRAWQRELGERLGAKPDEACMILALRARKAAEEGRLSEEEARDAAVAGDAIRLELMGRLGYYLTESSEHTAEYTPWFIKSHKPELIDRHFVPLDEYPRRCRSQIEGWEATRRWLVEDPSIEHQGSAEFGAYVMDAMETDTPYRIAGNVMNDDLIANLPRNACVEVPCLVDRRGVQPCRVGDLPEVCAALNRTSINPQLLTVEAALEGRRDSVYQAAMLDPHTSAELGIDEIVALCDELIAAHGDWLPELR